MSLYKTPPETLTISGGEYQISTDFREWIRFQSILISSESMEEKAEKLTEFMRSQGLPLTKDALDAAVAFYSGESKEHSSGKPGPRAFDFEQDSEYIFSAFLDSYGIDLTTENMHWWKFKALFKSLPEDCQMCKIMRYRTIDIKKVPKDQKRFYRDMKARYALDGGSNHTYRTEQEMKEYVKKRFEEAQSHMSALRSGKQPSMD